MFSGLFHYQFVQHAVLASILASIVCGIIGVIIIEKKLVMLSGGIAHTAYGGVGLGYLLGFEPIMGAFLISLCAAVCIAWIKQKGETSSEVLIGLFWPLGMALGILFIALMPGYPPDLSSYLFGSLLSITKSNLYLIAGITFIVLLLVLSLFDYWKAYLFDDEFAKVLGIATLWLDYLLLILVAMAVVVLIRVVGIILVLALLTAPPAIAGLFTKSLGARMAASVLIGAIVCLAGLMISYTLNIPSGAAIVILSVSAYLMTYFLISMISRRKLKPKGE